MSSTRRPPPDRSLQLSLGGIAAILAAAFASGSNRNAAFLALLGASAAFCALVLPRRPRPHLVVLFATLFLVSYEPHLAPVEMVSVPGQHLGFSPLESGTRRTYLFQVAQVAPVEKRCGPLLPTLVIQGTRLDQLGLKVDGVRILEKSIAPHFMAEILKAPLEPSAAGFFVSIWRRPDGLLPPEIRVGPEISGRRFFEDAVYLVYENSSCRVVVHPERRCTPACVQMFEESATRVLGS